MKNILITGGNGIVGSHLVDKLENDYNITIFDNSRKQNWWDTNAIWLKRDLVEYDQVKDAIKDIDGVIHLGAISRVKTAQEDPLTCMNINAMGTMNILEAVRTMEKPCWIILGSTIEPSSNIYGLSKHISELCGKRYVYDYGLTVLVLKFSSIYGSHREMMVDGDEKVIPRWIKNALDDKEIIVRTSNSSFDFIHIDDVVDGIICGISYVEDKGKGFFSNITLCTGKKTDLLDVAEMIVKETKSESKIKVAGTHRDDVYESCPHNAEMLLGFKAKIDVPEGIKKTVKFT